ncbi:MAG: GLPGLI family protein [Flavobacterium sp.]
MSGSNSNNLIHTTTAKRFKKASMVSVCLLFFAALHSQNGNFAVVEYQQINNTNSPNKYLTTLSVQGDICVFQEKVSTAKYEDKPLPEGTYRRLPKIAFEPYMKLNRKNKQLLFYEAIGRNTFLVRDNFTELKWDIQQDTKEIASYRCLKATTHYRGRQWDAWFAPDIPLPFGPWKLHGLPGLILEVSDRTNTYTYKALKIEFRKDEVLSKGFNTLMDARNSTPITYQQFLHDEEEYSENVHKKLSQETTATITRQKLPPSGRELQYEWEQ